MNYNTNIKNVAYSPKASEKNRKYAKLMRYIANVFKYSAPLLNTLPM